MEELFVQRSSFEKIVKNYENNILEKQKKYKEFTENNPDLYYYHKLSNASDNVLTCRDKFITPIIGENYLDKADFHLDNEPGDYPYHWFLEKEHHRRKELIIPRFCKFINEKNFKDDKWEFYFSRTFRYKSERFLDLDGMMTKILGKVNNVYFLIEQQDSFHWIVGKATDIPYNEVGLYRLDTCI